MEFPIMCSAVFPIALLPGWTTPVSYILPPYWAAVALHGTSTGGATLMQTLGAWGMLVLFSVIDLLISSWLFKAMLYKARADATLGME
jgi:ABC-2 type transport system permease protein